MRRGDADLGGPLCLIGDYNRNGYLYVQMTGREMPNVSSNYVPGGASFSFTIRILAHTLD